MNYDPNIRWAKHMVEVDLQQWEYKGTFTKIVSGNCKGASIIESAIERVIEDLIQENENGDYIAEFNLIDDNGNECEFELFEDGMDLEEQIKDMVVAVRIIDIQKEDR